MIEGIYRARILEAAEARTAFPLISLHHPQVTPDLWRDFVRRAGRPSRQRGGLVAITDRRGYIHAVFAYRLDPDLRNGTVLKVSDLVMGRLPGGTLPKAVLACVERLAHDLRSGCVRIDLLEGALAPADRDALRDAGFESRGLLFSRSVSKPGPDRRHATV